jgi:hypothetical protein
MRDLGFGRIFVALILIAMVGAVHLPRQAMAQQMALRPNTLYITFWRMI